MKVRQILREPEVLKASGYRPTQLWTLIQQGKFPAPIRLSEGGRAKGWFADEIEAFQEARVAERAVELAAGPETKTKLRSQIAASRKKRQSEQPAEHDAARAGKNPA